MIKIILLVLLSHRMCSSTPESAHVWQEGYIEQYENYTEFSHFLSALKHIYDTMVFLVFILQQAYKKTRNIHYTLIHRQYNTICTYIYLNLKVGSMTFSFIMCVDSEQKKEMFLILSCENSSLSF